METRVIQRGAATKGYGAVAEKENESRASPVGPGHDGEPSLLDSDSIQSIPSNPDSASITVERGKVSAVASAKQNGRQILVVEDEAPIADTLAIIFQMQKYEVRVAYTAERAIELIAEWRPDLAILDVMLPGMNGIDLAIVMRANYPKCHVLLFSGHANTSMLLEEANKKGQQFEVLAKPVHPDLMLERAAALLAAQDEPRYD
jgi:CheY-like chemotaxis protein